MKTALIIAWLAIVFASTALASGVISVVLGGPSVSRIGFIVIDLLIIGGMSALIREIKAYGCSGQ